MERSAWGEPITAVSDGKQGRPRTRWKGAQRSPVVRGDLNRPACARTKSASEVHVPIARGWLERSAQRHQPFGMPSRPTHPTSQFRTIVATYRRRRFSRFRGCQFVAKVATNGLTSSPRGRRATKYKPPPCFRGHVRVYSPSCSISVTQFASPHAGTVSWHAFARSPHGSPLESRASSCAIAGERGAPKPRCDL